VAINFHHLNVYVVYAYISVFIYFIHRHRFQIMIILYSAFGVLVLSVGDAHWYICLIRCLQAIYCVGID